MVWVSIADHAVPFVDEYEVTVVPFFTRRTQYGAFTPGPDVLRVRLAPSLVRRSDVTPFEAETATQLNDASAARELRIMTPLSEDELAAVIESTRAAISTSPATC